MAARVWFLALAVALALSSLPAAYGYGVKEFLSDYTNPKVSRMVVRGNVVLTSDLPELQRNLTIVGAGRSRPVIDGGAKFKGIVTDYTLLVRNLEFQRFVVQADRGGAAILAFGDTKVESCVFRDNRAGTSATDPNNGGAVYFYGNRWSIKDSEFLGNRADGLGGALYTLGESSGRVVSSVFKDNYSKARGGAVTFAGSFVRIEKCSFQGNKEDGAGGGALSCQRSSCRISSSSFQNNVAKGQGGAIRFFADDEGGFGSFCKGNNFSGNRATTNGSTDNLYIWIAEGGGKSWSFCAEAPAKTVIDAPKGAVVSGDCSGCPK